MWLPGIWSGFNRGMIRPKQALIRPCVSSRVWVMHEYFSSSMYSVRRIIAQTSDWTYDWSISDWIIFVQKCFSWPWSGPDRESQIKGKHEAWLWPDLAARDPIGLLSGTGQTQTGPNRTKCFITGLGHVWRFSPGRSGCVVSAKTMQSDLAQNGPKLVSHYL